MIGAEVWVMLRHLVRLLGRKTMKLFALLLATAGLLLAAPSAFADHPCDFDGSGAFDQTDKDLLKAAVHSRPGDSNWIPEADRDGDGVISAVDVGLCLRAL
jgi:hypothetical protein